MGKIVNKRLSDLRVMLATGVTGIEHAMFESTIFDCPISAHIYHGNQAFYIDGNSDERECHEDTVDNVRRMIALAAISRAAILADRADCLDRERMEAARLVVRSYGGR